MNNLGNVGGYFVDEPYHRKNIVSSGHLTRSDKIKQAAHLLKLTLAIRMTVMPIRILIQTTVVQIMILIRMTGIAMYIVSWLVSINSIDLFD